MRVIYAPRSRRDLASIHLFITTKSGTPRAADEYVTRLLNACDSLEILPERYASYRYAPGWRMMPFEDYLIFFQVYGNDVRIGHVRHAARKPFRA